MPVLLRRRAARGSDVAVTTAPDGGGSDGVAGRGRENERRGSGDREDRRLFRGASLQRREDNGSLAGGRAGSRVSRSSVVLRMEQYHIWVSMAMVNHRRTPRMLERAEDPGVTYLGRWEAAISVGGGINFTTSMAGPVAPWSSNPPTPQNHLWHVAAQMPAPPLEFPIRSLCGGAFNSAFQTSFKRWSCSSSKDPPPGAAQTAVD